MVKIDFKNAFNSVDRLHLLNVTHDKYPSIYKYTFSAYGRHSNLYFNSHVLPSMQGVQQGDPEGPPIFCDSINEIVVSLKSELNIWYLDDGNLADHYDVVLKDLAHVIAASAKVGLKVKPSKCELVFLGKPSEELRDQIFKRFDDICDGITVTELDDLIILGAGVGKQAVRDFVQSKIDELDTLSTRLCELSAHTALFLLKNALGIPKLTYALRCSTCFLEPDLLLKYDNLMIQILEKITNVDMSGNSTAQACLPVYLGGLGIPATYSLASSCFLASVSGSQVAVAKIVPGSPPATVEEEAMSVWSQLSAEADPPDFNKRHIQKKWTTPVFKALEESLISICSDLDRARLQSVQGKLAGSWLIAFPSNNLGLKLSNHELRLSVAMRLAARICEPHTCICGVSVASNGLHGLSCRKSAGRFTRHTLLNNLFKQALSTIHIPSVLEPPGLTRSDGKRPDGVTTVPWKRGRVLAWDVTVVDATAPSRISSFVAAKAATDAEERKIAKYSDLTDQGYLFQPLAFECQGGAGESTAKFVAELGKSMIHAKEEPNAAQYFRQRLSITLQKTNAACILGTLADDSILEEIFYVF